MDPSLLPIANEIASQQANPTQKVMTAANCALSYASARCDNCITYYSCDMHLFLHVDASYLSLICPGLMPDLSSEATSFLAMKSNPSTSISMELHMSSPPSYHASSPVQARRNTLLYLQALNKQLVCELFSPILATLNPLLLACMIIPVLLASLPTQ